MSQGTSDKTEDDYKQLFIRQLRIMKKVQRTFFTRWRVDIAKFCNTMAVLEKILWVMNREVMAQA